MHPTTRQYTHHNSRGITRLLVVLAGVVAVTLGLVAPAGADDTTTRFSPTFTVVPGGLCGAVIDATKLPQERPGEFSIQASITRIGVGCGPFQLYVRWRNLDTGLTGGQSNPVDANGHIGGAPDGVVTGLGFGPGAGRVEAWIDTGSADYYPNEPMIPHISGRATFTLN